MAVQSSHGLHSMGQGFAGKRMLGYQRDPVMRTGEPTPAPEPPCPACGRSVEATTCTTYRNGKTYRTTYRTCLSARKLRYGKTQPTCAVQVEEVEIDNEMPNPTGKRPTLDRIPAKADQAEWKRLKHHEREWDNLLDAMAESVFTATDEEILEEVRDEGRNPDQAAFAFESLLLDTVKSHFRVERQRLEQEEPEIPLAARGRIPALPADALKLSNKHLIEASGVRSIALYDWFADRPVTQETENRIKDGLRKLQDQEAGRTHVPADEASSIEARISRLEELAQESPPGPTEWQEWPAEWKEHWLDLIQKASQQDQTDIWHHAAFFEKVAQTMAEADIHIFRAVCQRVLEQVARG